jgi:hypothetical protein
LRPPARGNDKSIPRLDAKRRVEANGNNTAEKQISEHRKKICKFPEKFLKLLIVSRSLFFATNKKPHTSSMAQQSAKNELNARA